jgi:hypothetical protein
MNLDRRPSRFSSLPCLLLLLLAWITAPDPLAAEEIEVSSADPPQAEQATYDLDVVIKGNGFGRDSQVHFYETGTTNPGGVTVRNVRYKNQKRLIAKIDVAEGATVGKFDIEVTSRGRKGQGTELFSVLEKGTGVLNNLDVPVEMQFERWDVYGDEYRILSDVFSTPYSHGVDGVEAFFRGDGGTSMRLDTAPKKASIIRKVDFDFGSCAVDPELCSEPFAPDFQDEAPIFGWNMNLKGGTWRMMSVGVDSRLPVLVRAFFTDEEGQLYSLRFSPLGTGPQLSSYVWAECTALAADEKCGSWRVYTDPNPDCPFLADPPCCTDFHAGASDCVGNWAALDEMRPEVYRGVYFMDFEMNIRLCGAPGAEACSW